MDTSEIKLPYSPGDGVWVKATYRGQSTDGQHAMVTLESSLFPDPTPISVDKSAVRGAFRSDEPQGELLDALYSARNLLDSPRCRKAIETVAEAIRRGEVTVQSNREPSEAEKTIAAIRVEVASWEKHDNTFRERITAILDRREYTEAFALLNAIDAHNEAVATVQANRRIEITDEMVYRACAVLTAAYFMNGGRGVSQMAAMRAALEAALNG